MRISAFPIFPYSKPYPNNKQYILSIKKKVKTMKNFTKKALLSVAIMSVMSATYLATAQQFPPQKVLTDLTESQIKAINALGPIPKNDPTSPAYDFKLSQILTPAQAAQYNKLKDGERRQGKVDFPFNIDSK